MRKWKKWRKWRNAEKKTANVENTKSGIAVAIVSSIAGSKRRSKKI